MHSTERLCIGFLLLMLVALLDSSAVAQELRVAPGPLAKAHAKLDSATGCLECHGLAGGKSGTLTCLGCHDHKAIKNDVEKKRGFHGSLTKPCLECHTDHKGRAYEIADWTKVGGRSGFNHARTGFALSALHAKTKCTDCHKKRTASGRTSFVGLDADCDACHKNPHEFTKAKLRQSCERCHVPGSPAKQMKPDQLPFDHGADTGIALVGKHGQVQCNKCHKGGKMPMETTRTCVDCHKHKHGKTFLGERKCVDCHNPGKSWKDTHFDHSRTRFPLVGAHGKTTCKKCHKTKDEKLSRRCRSCHDDPHRGRFQRRSCTGCHRSGGGTFMVFNHARKAKYPLTGRHGNLKCRECHRGQRPTEFEKLPSAECKDCHRHKNAHNGQFGDKPCISCHVGGGTKDLVFDHKRDSRFPLTGLHEPLAKDCKKCHQVGSYRTGKITCADCHKDVHKGELGIKCERCHTPDRKFDKVALDHNRVSVFPLEGLHLKAECAKCHPNKKYKTGKTRCVDCHGGEKDPHRGKLGEACERCHTADKGAPKFRHDTMTSFTLTGRHLEVACGFCHQSPLPGGPQEPGWTKGLPAPEVQKSFPLAGKACADCHRDRHKGRFGSACESCHKTTAFKDVSPTVHDTGSFRLEGTHDRLPCERCHRPRRLLAGLGQACQSCHYDDDPHGHALGPFCGDCHRQIDWRPAQFSHQTTGFALRGAHRSADCRGCHGVGTFQGLPTDCVFCHQQDTARASDPVHTAELSRCEDCHSEVGFVPAKRYHPTFELVGQHNLIRCRNCHGAGVYAGLPTLCEGCHLARYYDRSNQPDHVASGFSTACDECHTPVGWRPARAP